MLIVRNEKMITTFTKIKIKEEKIWLLLTITVV